MLPILHAILKYSEIDNSGNKQALVTINPATGAAIVIGNFDAGFAGIAFSCTDLYGVTGDGGDPSETLFKISTTDAIVTEFLTLGNGDDGETIDFNSTDGNLYHASGHDSACNGLDEGVCFERIFLDTSTVTDIDVSAGALIDEDVQALTWWSAQGVILWKQNHGPDTPLFSVTTGGSEALIGEMDHQAKGLAFVPVENGAACNQEVKEAVPIPSLSLWSMILMFLLILSIGGAIIRFKAPG